MNQHWYRIRLLVTSCVACACMTTIASADLFIGSFNNDRVLRYRESDGAPLGTFAVGGGLDGPIGVVFGPDGNLYVSSYYTHQVLQYNGVTGAFMRVFCNVGNENPQALAFGPDNNLYTIISDPAVLRFNGTTGVLIDTFATHLIEPDDMVFHDGSLYVSDYGDNSVKRFNGMTGAYLGVFASGSGLNGAQGLTFGPDNNLYVAGAYNNGVLRYNGLTGGFMGIFAFGSGLDTAVGVRFGPDGNLYVSSYGNDNVIRFSGSTGAYMSTWVPTGGGGLSSATYMTFHSMGPLPPLGVAADAAAVELSVAPNPTSGTSSISFSLAQGTPYHLSINDVAGIEVRAFDGAASARTGILWDGTDGAGHRVPAGIYFLKLVANDMRTVEKMIVLP